MDESKVIGMTVDEVAKSLRVDVKTVRKLIKEQGLPARLVGRSYRIEEGALRQWLAARRQATFDSLFELFKTNPTAAADQVMGWLSEATGSTKEDLRQQLDKCLHPEDYEDKDGSEKTS